MIAKEDVRGCRFSRCLGRELFAGGFASGGLAGGLFSTGHLNV